ncbi:hypothetical protein ACNOYE_13695 [Nannocystaceae bacterium ST9]
MTRFAMTRRITSLALAASLALLGPRVASASEPSFGVAGLAFQQAEAPDEGELVFVPAGGDRSVKAVWYDGDALILAASRRAISVLGREGEPTREDVTIDSFVDADGTRAISGSTAVFAAADGRLLRWRAGDLDAEQVPLIEGDELVAVAIDASGTIYAIGRTHALYERTNLRWKVFEYPSAMRPLGAAASPGGQVFLVGRDGLLVRFDDGNWDRPLVPGLSPETIRATWYECWYSAVTQTLWVRAGRDRLLEVAFGEERETEVGPAPAPVVPQAEPEPIEKVEPAEADAAAPALRMSNSVPVREHPIPLGPPQPGESLADFTAVAGLARAEGDEVIVAAGGQVWLWQRERFRELAHDVGLVHDLAVDAGTNVIWLATQSGLRRLSITPADEDAPGTELSEQDTKLLDRMTKRDAWRRNQADKPKIFWMPTLRIDNGVSFPLGADPRAGYSLEIAAGAMLAPIDPYQDRGPTLWLWPELAYRFETHPTRGGHLFDAGMGIGYGNHLIAAFYRPRLVVGGIDVGGNVFGFRHGLALEALWGVVGLEFSHQFVDSNAGRLDDLRLGIGINLAPLIWMAILWGTIPTSD